jgi:two-component sensor histidine kinase
MNTQAVRVLYIDDDAATARLVQRHLERAGYVVKLAYDGESGLSLARSEVFDAVALDYFMPGRDGLEVLADLVDMPLAPPVIFVTAAEEPRTAITALKTGAFDYVIKDVQGTFLEFLDTSIRQSQEHIRLRREKLAAEQGLRESLERSEKLTAQQALMMKEVNHRVANSLQLISSLIELQARKIVDPDAREMLRRAAERVDAVTLVHRRLYTSNDVEFVEMDKYLQGLVDELQRLVETEERQGRIQLIAEPIRIETDKAVSIGLIVNELVTNAVKYAYPAGQCGAIRVGFFQRPGEDVQLVVEDDGIGYPDGAAPRGSGLGGIIVNAMARTANATVTLDTHHKGTRFVVSLGQLLVCANHASAASPVA